MNYASDVLDEIALEGLDGITVEGLWLRLSQRPEFIFATQVSTDCETQSFLWNVVRHLRNVDFFCLKEPRKPLTVRNLYTIDRELGIITEEGSQDSEDLYPHKLVNDTETGVYGSCSTYDTRENVTSAVRKLDLISVLNLYQNKLVVVANQSIRLKALIGLHTNPNLDISPIQYCILERIGRSRHHGELTQGKLGLAALGEDPKTIFYLRKYLLKNNLITKQVYQQKLAYNSSGLLLHLPRFYHLVKPRYISLIEKVLKILADQPNQIIEYEVLREQLPVVLKRLTKLMEFQKYLRSDARIPYRSLYPDADIKDWKQKTNDKEKKVRVIELRDPDTDIRELQRRLVGNFDDEDDEDEQLGILDASKCYIDVPILTQCSMLLKGRGVEGLSQSAVARELGFFKVQARTVTKNLVKVGAAGMYMVDVGRQRITKYYLKHGAVDDDDKNVVLDGKYTNDTQFALNCPLPSSKSSTSSRKRKRKNRTDPKVSKETSKSIKSETESKSETLPTSGTDNTSEENVVNTSPVVETKKSTKRRTSSTDSTPESVISKKKVKLQVNSDEKNNETEIRPKTPEKMKEVEKMDVDLQVDTVVEPNDLPDSTDLNMEVSNETDLNTDDIQSTSDTVIVPSGMKKPDSEKVNIEVIMSDDYHWLLPKTCKNELVKIKEKSMKTFRLLKRSNLIIEAVHRLKIITDLKRLVVLINESEFQEGLRNRMDKKSLLRILFKLAFDKHIKVYRALLKHGTKMIYLNFVCSPDVTPDDPVIKSAIEFNRLKFRTMICTKRIVPSVERLKRVNIAFEKRNSFTHYPKFNRMKLVHKFLFYLVYDFTGNETLRQDLAKTKITKEYQLTDDELNELPKLYMSKVDEYMFVPPLPKYNEQGQKTGWCLMSDILIRMPLSIFIRLVQIPYFIPELDEYMNHPIKRYYLVSSLPSRIHNCITATRKYIFTIHEVMTKLVYIGLLQFGAHHNKEKDQIFMFVNRNATLIDTTLSKPGYNKISTGIDYPVQKYRFESIQNAHEYWHDCWKICMNTQLGARSQIVGSELVFENLQDKPDMINAIRPHEFMEALEYDTGFIPGDRMGAAGFDSALFAHLKRNWVFRNKSSALYDDKKTAAIRKVQQLVLSCNLNAPVRPLKRKLLENTSPKQTVPKSSSVKEKYNPLNPILNRQTRNRKPVIKIRRIDPVNKSLHRKPFYDQVDKEALKRMSKLRVDWSLEEDRILLICKVASAFICPDTRKQVNANMFLAYREVLHKSLQSSKNKTSRACQRRVAYMLRSANTRHNVNLCIEELKQDEFIVEKYGNTLELIQQEAKMKGKKIPDLGNMWRERFRSLVDDLMSRYNNNNFSFSHVTDSRSSNGFLLPDDLNEFHSMYNLQHVEKKYQKPKDMYLPIMCINDIYSAVINATIHSTLSCNSDKTSWSYHLFSIYQQYPERILRHTLNRLRENHMVSFKRSYQVRNKSGSNYYLPLSASPYQLSISYINLIQTKYQSNMYMDCCKTFCNLLENAELAKDGNHHNKGYELLSLTGGSTAAMVELYCSDIITFNIDIPNQVIILDPNVKNKDETYSRLVQRYKDVLTSYKKDLTSSVLFQKHNYLSACNRDLSDNFDDDGLDEAEEDVKSCEIVQGAVENTRAMHNVAKAASRIALYLMNDDSGSPTGLVPKEMDHVYDFFVVNSCKIFVKIVRCLDMLTDNKAHDSPTFENDPSCNIINEPIIKNVLRSIRNSAMFYDITPVGEDGLPNIELVASNDDDDCFKVKEYDSVILDRIIDTNFEADDVDLVKSILSAIEIKNKFGLTNSELIAEFGNSFKIVDLLNELIELSFVLKTGVVHCRYIYYLYTRPWLLHSYRNVRGDKDSRALLQNIKHFEVKKNSGDNFEEVCSDDESFDSQKDTDSIQNVSSSSTNTTETTTSPVKSDDVKVDDVISESRFCLAKEDLATLKNKKISEPVRVVMRPWIRVDSTLNRRVLDMMLCSVLSHIMLYPGVSLSNIQYRFSPGYQPHHTREVCDVLLKLNCVIQYCVTIKGKPSLFSKPCEVLVEKSTGLESDDDIRYEADKFAIINLGKFLDTRPYTKDFIKSLIGK